MIRCTKKYGLSLIAVWTVAIALIMGTTLHLHRQDTIAGYLLLWVVGSVGLAALSRRRCEQEERLRQQGAFLESLLNTIPDHVFWKNTEGALLGCNDACARQVFGRSCHDAIGCTDFDLVADREMAERLRADDRRVMTCGVPQTIEEPIQLADGRRCMVETHKAPLLDAAGRVIGLIGVARDITQRKRAEEALERAKNDWELTFDAVPDLIGIVDADCAIRRVNRAMAERFGLEGREPVGQTCYAHMHRTDAPHPQCPHGILLEDGQGHTAELEIPHLGGWFDVTVSPLPDSDGNVIGSVHIVRDITERKRAEEERQKLEAQLFQAQKMEAVGLLAGGIAHDFNNMLQVIISYASLLERKVEGEKLHGYVNGIMASAARAADLTRGLLAYSRKQTLNLAPTDMNGVIKSVHQLLGRIIGEDIELVTELSPGELVVLADANQLQQVLINLAANARDAMPTGGTLTIRSGREEIGQDFVAACGHGTAGPHARFSVSDTGSGMDGETAAKIFEPFFTTKEVGKGTGLGLAIVYGIVTQHNGFVCCQSEEGHGTSFTVYLPAGSPAEEKPEEIASGGPVGGSETILLAEDDPQVLEIARLILETEGYRVITAANGEEAVARYRENGAEIALVLLDAVMPKKNGMEACDEIRRLNPAAKVCFISGYSHDILHDRTALAGDVPVISKPILPDNILKMIRVIMDG